MTRRWRVAAAIAGVITGVIAAFPTSTIAQRATIVGRVSVKGSAISIGYAVVALKTAGYERFTDNDGHFAIRDVAPGRVALSARRIGYAPLDTTFAVAAGDSIQLELEMTLVTIRLPAIYSLAHACAHPGRTNAELSAELLSLFEQVKESAERNRLLSRSYPFEMVVERRISRPEPALEARFIAFDTVRRTSERLWRYEAGKMLGTREYEPGVFGGKWTTLTMPELADYADDRFLDSHCFDYGGIDLVDGDSLLLIEFKPAENIHDPDIAGTLYLDPKTYQLRMTAVALVNLNKQLREQISGQAIRATFKEIFPGVPVIDAVSSVVFPIEVKKGPSLEPSTEDQRTLSVRFLKGKP
ncbi:MAG TPA: carboxypeptidase-like regulatory domain-containing protein [Gemmatimonadaceae bacterium]|nr:carboxypeptidase-like regulatory domain-containing protein [Gemmatimonadaceae bacterium]